ncbi:hypothetical protein [Fibrobacter sp.]|uniref:hypothetical protein n=1 Tax=Fibrobacter sp. TaxID=35828 RepID=UPI00386EBF60
MKTVITNNGLNIMNQTRADGTVQYWIGYFGLAYVPDEYRVSESNDAPLDPLSADMTELTQKGDVIYNLFQGAMTPVGLDTDIGESAAYNLFNECMYTGSVISKYRYVLDPETGANKLIVLESVNEDGHPVEGDDIPYGLQKYSEYFGVGAKDEDNSVVEKSKLPIPAPLYYRGEPVAWDAGVTFNDTVSSDTRIISKSPNWDSGDKYSWNASKDFTYGSPEDSYHYLTSFEQAQSVSNFNRFHAGANVTGYAVDYEPACRNLAFATKLFPISHYDVISTTDDEHVANVKYTVEVDLDEVFSKITRQSTAYYENGQKLDPVTDKDKLAKYKLGFKFNRIGLYAVPVTLHAYNSNTADNQSKNKYNIQMQIAGNSKPRLFAVRDLSSPIVLSEDGMHKCVFNFQLNVADTGIVDESGIYYNLYESDAITWYKNQLIANASAAEAVTTLGVEINYLRQQIADMSGENTACGVGDDGDRYALEGHTHNYMKNIVDSTKTGNGAVRGIDTLDESTPIKIYKTNGRAIVEDEHGVPHYQDDPETAVPVLIEATNVVVGDESMNLGRDSATLGTRSINMSDYGILGSTSSSTLLMGGRGKTSFDKYADGHLAVAYAKNSIINMHSGELEYVTESMLLSSETDSWIDGSVDKSILIGHNDVSENYQASQFSTKYKFGQVAKSILLGRNEVDSLVEFSSISGELNFGGMQPIGTFTATSDMDAVYMNSSTVGYGDEDDIFASALHGSVHSVNKTGSNTRISSGNHFEDGNTWIDRNVAHVYASGENIVVPHGTSNSIMFGQNINNHKIYDEQLGGFRTATALNVREVLTVDEFNDKYGNPDRWPYPSTDAIWNNQGKDDMIIIGTGTLNFLNGQGGTPTTVSRDVKGVTLYVSYSSYVWGGGVTCGSKTGDLDHDGTVFGTNPEYFANLYSTPGHLKNMIMLGDDLNAGYGSENSIIMGDRSGTRKIQYKNSFINTLGDDYGYVRDATTGPFGYFDNIWWIGHAETKQEWSGGTDSPNTTGHFIAAQQDSDDIRHKATFKDRFVFIGSDKNAYGFSYWYGVSKEGWDYISKRPNTLDWEYSFEDTYEPCKAPMIYTGGLALGGYGTRECNFMLLKIGTSRYQMEDPTEDKTHIYKGFNTNNNLATALINEARGSSYSYSKIIRSTALGGPWTETATNTTYLYRDYSNDYFADLAVGETSVSFTFDADEVYDPETPVTISLYTVETWSGGEKNGTKICDMTVTINGSTVTGTIDAALAERARACITYRSYHTNGNAIYDYYDPSVQDEHHLMVDCPFAGMALVVQDKQELDGTLHIGLGKPAGNGAGAGRAVITDFNPLSGDAHGGGTWSLNHPDWGSGEDHTYIYQGWKDKHMDKVLTCRPTLTDFIAPVDDMQREHTGTCTLQWYSEYPGFNFEDGITVLDWYFWYAISDYYYTKEDSKTYYHEQWMMNARKQLAINMNSLKEGVVYEVNLHVVRVNGPDSSTIGDQSQHTDATYRRQASPVSKQYDGTHIDADIFYDPLIYFSSYNTKSYSGDCTVHHWGASDTTSNNTIKPTFYPVTDPNSGAVDSENTNHQLTELARAKMLFTRIGDKVYIMEY